MTKQARALFDKLHKLGTPQAKCSFFLAIASYDLLTQFETGLSDINLDT